MAWAQNVQGILIDKRGRLWHAGDNRLRRSFGAQCSDDVLAQFLVRNLGFICYRASDDSCAIRLSLSRLQFKSYAALCSLIDERKPRRISVSWFDGRWHSEICREGRGALDKILRLSTNVRSSSDIKYLNMARSPQSLCEGNPLHQLLGVWREKSGHLDIDRHSAVLMDRLCGKFVLVHRDASTSKLVFSRIGAGLEMYHKGWARNLIGAPIDHQPDVRYAQSVANCWREAMLLNEPVLKDVDAIVNDPVIGRTYRANYTRLTLPIEATSGSTHLLSASVTDRTINLRTKVH